MNACQAASALSLMVLPVLAAAQAPEPLAAGLKHLTSVAVTPDGSIYLGGASDPPNGIVGSVLRVEGGKIERVRVGNDVRALAAWKDVLFVVERTRVLAIDKNRKAAVYADSDAFPATPIALDGLAVDDKGTLYVSDAGDGKSGGAVYRIGLNRKVEAVATAARTPALKSPGALVLDGVSFALVLDPAAGELHRLRFADGAATKVADGLGTPVGLTFDRHGRLFITDAKAGRVLGINRPGDKPVVVAAGLPLPGAVCLDAGGKRLLVTDAKAGTLTAIPATIPGAEVDETPMPLQAELTFPNLKWAGWEPINEAGLSIPLRPIVLTHAGDGSNRVFVATQQGVIHVFPNDQKVEKSEVFLDISALVQYQDKTNEEGFLGLAFHPKYKQNGEFFVFYTIKTAKLTNVLVRYKVSKDNPNRADPATAEELLRIERPYWNHDGGTLCFGPDGYLYLCFGDGGLGNDPHANGQNLKTLLGKILRLDVNRKDAGKAYAIPSDNPFADNKEARPEIWASGIRNVWRMSFDRKTGKLWAADVGQDIFEEINIVTRGANLGWSVREGLHPFGAKGTGPRSDLLEPIWEYRHDLGKCIVGGHVYRGPRLPELEGHYLYADYITGILWALKYDEAKGRVTANRVIGDGKYQVISWGEDEAGDVYFMIVTPKGQGIYRFAPAAKKG